MWLPAPGEGSRLRCPGRAVTRLAGATRRRALAVVICEALLVTGTALVAGTAVAVATTLPMPHTDLGTWTPVVPAIEVVT